MTLDPWGRNAERIAEQLVVRIDSTLAAAVDEMVEAGVVASRSDAVRRALHDMVDARRRDLIGQAIVDGYTRIPQTEEERSGLEWETEEMIAEEPW